MMFFALAFALDYYKLGCERAAIDGDIATCMEWKQYREVHLGGKEQQFKMGCGSQLLYRKIYRTAEQDIILCNKLFLREKK